MQEKLALLEWLAANYKKFGCVLEFVTNKSQEGSQFCRGFGGIGGILRYQVGLPVLPGIVTKGSRGASWSTMSPVHVWGDAHHPAWMWAGFEPHETTSPCSASERGPSRRGPAC